MIKDITSALEVDKNPANHGVSLKVAKAIFGVSTAEMAREFEVSPSGIDKWAKTRKWNQERIDSVSEFFGMSPESFESLAYRALSESIQSDCDALETHLRERHPNFAKQTAQIVRHYDKIVDLLHQIEGVA